MARTPALVACLFLVAGLAGCLNDSDRPAGADDGDAGRNLEPLTEATFERGGFASTKIESFDGTPIHVDLQFPDGDGPWPVLVQYTPYSALGEQATATQIEAGEDQYLNGLAERYIPYGYAVAVAHVRGTGESGGCLTVGGPEEGLDGVALVEGLAAMEWSNGKVALMGTSYVGTTPMETAIHNPPHLTTIIPKAGVTEWYRYYFENGVQRVNEDPPPGSDITDPVFWIGLGTLPGWRTGAFHEDDVPCTLDFTVNFWGQDDYNDYWQVRDHGQYAANISVPTLFNHGWDDGNVGTSMIPAFWYGLGDDRLGMEKRAWLMQHGHGIPSSKQAYYDYEHRWLDFWMLGRDNGALDLPHVVLEDSEGQWRGEAAWPPKDTVRHRVWLGEGTLTAAPPADATASWTDYGPEEPPVAPVPPLSPPRLTFEAPIDEDRLLVGEPLLHLVAHSDLPDTQFGALLWDVAEDGTASLITRGYLDARHRDSLEQGEDLEPDTVYEFEWALHPQDYVLRAGHSLRLDLSGGDAYVVPETTRATNTAHFGPDGSWLELPVVPLDDRERFEDAPLVAPHLFGGDAPDAADDA